MMVARYPVVSNDTLRLRDAMDRIFGEPIFRTIPSGQRPTGQLQVPVDVFGNENDVFVFASLPGVNPDELEITVDDSVLSISGQIANVAKSSEAEGATWFLHQMAHGSFKRSVTLPVEVNVEAAEASFENGILRLRLPKAEAARPRQIKVRPVSEAAATPSITETSEEAAS